MSSKPEGVLPAFGGAAGRQEAAGFQRLPPPSGQLPGNARSEPLRAALVRPAIAVVAVAVIAAFPAAIVAIPLKTLKTALPPTALVAATKPAIHSGKHGKTALLAVIQRLVERIGRIRDLLHGSRRGRHVVGALAQTRHRIVRLLRGITLRR